MSRKQERKQKPSIQPKQAATPPSQPANKSRWLRRNIFAIVASIIIPIAGILISLTVPEVRQFFGLDRPPQLRTQYIGHLLPSNGAPSNAQQSMISLSFDWESPGGEIAGTITTPQTQCSFQGNVTTDDHLKLTCGNDLSFDGYIYPDGHIKGTLSSGSTVTGVWYLDRASTSIPPAGGPPSTLTSPTPTNISATQTAAIGVDVRANGVYAQGKPLVYDRLNANSPSKWSENRDPQGNWGCQFQGGAYHVYQKLQDSVVTCVAKGTDLPDYTYEVTMSLLKGDSGGLLFRVNSPKGMYLYYYFLIIPNGGKYQFGLFNGRFQPLQSDFSPAILTGLQQKNVLGVHVNKDKITLYANYQKIYSVKDTSYSHGAVGVFVYEHSSSTEAAFTDARIWTP